MSTETPQSAVGGAGAESAVGTVGEDSGAARRDWYEWHRPYQDPDSHLSHRLEVIQRYIEEWLDSRPEGDLTIVSLCAGQGLDVVGVLRRRDAERVRAVLVEYNEGNVRDARTALEGLPSLQVEVRQGDAGSEETFRSVPKADLLLLVGIFGNVSDEDVRRTIEAAPLYCNPGARVLWSRARRAPDLVPSVRKWFSEYGFTELSYDIPEGSPGAVGANLLTKDPSSVTEPEWPVFTFVH